MPRQTYTAQAQAKARTVQATSKTSERGREIQGHVQLWRRRGGDGTRPTRRDPAEEQQCGAPSDWAKSGDAAEEKRLLDRVNRGAVRGGVYISGGRFRNGRRSFRRPIFLRPAGFLILLAHERNGSGFRGGVGWVRAHRPTRGHARASGPACRLWLAQGAE
jgi:hypothetical protein